MNQTCVLLDTAQPDGIATITLNRPDALNALNVEMAHELRDAIRHVESDPTIRTVVLTGAGTHFMAGGDIKTFHATLTLPPRERRQLFDDFIDLAHDSILRIRRMRKPVIASVRGAVAGFGLSLMNSCDLAVSSDDAYFTMAYRHIGASPDGSGTYGLPRIVGMKRAMAIALLGDRFNAQYALDIGLLNQVVPAEQLSAATLTLARRLSSGPIGALGRTKALLNESMNRQLLDQLDAEKESFLHCADDTDFGIGLQAFMDRKTPQFSSIESA